MKIPFNKPYATGKEFNNIFEAIGRNHISGDGLFTKKCHEWLERRTGCKKALLTHSCTAALEMSAILCGIEAGDEVIMPSFTFVSTANAFAIRGAVPVFVDIRPDTMNIDESLIEAAITPRTKAVVPVHYAGVGCEMDEIMRIAEGRNLFVIEDAAHGIMASYKGRQLGSIGHLGAVSFHETKNLISGEGGALLVNDERFGERAEIIREKGTNRMQFFRGQVDKYTWVDIGSSYLPSDMVAAFLWAQFGEADAITRRRLEVWEYYHKHLAPLEADGLLKRPFMPEHCSHNAHMYYVMINDAASRTALIKSLKEEGVDALFHYVPLHSSPAGKRLGRAAGSLAVTDDVSLRLLRLPLWIGLAEEEVEQIAAAVRRLLHG